MAIAICIDCNWHHQHSQPIPGLECRPDSAGHVGEPPIDFICEHFRPDHWVAKGFVRNWGDAAVMNWPHLEILRKEDGEEVQYVILCPLTTRRPVIIFAKKGDHQGGFSWGSY